MADHPILFLLLFVLASIGLAVVVVAVYEYVKIKRMFTEEVQMKPWYQSKTLWTNIGILIGTIGSYFTMGLPLNSTLALGGGAVINLILRMVTGQPIGDPNAPAQKP